MARPRTPTNVLNARGAFRKHPERKRSDPEPSAPLSAPPDHLNDTARECWAEIAEAAPVDVLTESDRIAIEIAAQLLAHFRQDPAEFPSTKLLRLEVLLGKFGMTPADRSRVSRLGPNRHTKNPFGDL